MTARDYIKKHMPEPYRTKAQENIKEFPIHPDKTIDCMSKAIEHAFRWKLTEQGRNFWVKCACERDFSKWPELPNKQDGEECIEYTYKEKFHALRKACCDLLGNTKFDEAADCFSISMDICERFEGVVRSLPPEN